ncbi:MAG: leucine-rich repeat domain-containing protein [Bacteroidota bacterium]
MKYRFYLLVLCLVCTGCGSLKLDERDKGYSSFPEEVCETKGIEKLYLGANPKGWTIYPPLSAASHAGVMNGPQSSNRISHLPNCIEKLSQLKVLHLSGVGLETLHPNLFTLSQLKHLDLSFNPKIELNACVEQFQQLKNLQVLNLMGCKIDHTYLVILKEQNPRLHVYTNQDFQDAIKEDKLPKLLLELKVD